MPKVQKKKKIQLKKKLKFLLPAKKKLQNLKQRLNQPLNEPLEATEPIYTPNLFQEKSISIPDSTPRIIVYLIIFIQVIYLIILLLNFSVNRQLEQLVIEVEDLSDTFSSRKDIIADVTKVNDRIATYKSIESKRSLISRHAEVMNTDVPKGFYSSTSFDTDKANLNIVVSEPINASIYMSNLFSNKDIESISLLYAGLNRGGSYDISIEVTYK